MKLIKANTIALLLSLGALTASSANAAEPINEITKKHELVQNQLTKSQEKKSDGDVAYKLK